MEYTKTIPGTDYLVTRDGDVLGKRVGKLRPKLTKSGYYELHLTSVDGIRLYKRVHRLVAEAFIPNPDNKPFVNHRDGNKINNCVENLEWVTHQENMEHAKNHGLIARAEENPRSIHTTEQVEEICKLLQMGYRGCDIAKSLNVEPHNVSLIRSGAVWKHISCKYNIPLKSRSLSDSTIRWICEKIVEGLTQGQILSLSTNKRITKNIIKDIRRRRIYRDISINYF